MKKICWWMGTDALTLIKNPPGNKIWHCKLFFYRIKWRILIRFFDEHWVVEKHLGKYLKKYGVKNIKVKYDDPLYGKVEKKKHDGFNICLLYTSPSPRDQRGSRMPSSA